MTAPPKPTLRRFTWCRLHHDLLSDSRWALVAKLTGLGRELVEALVVRLEAHASDGRREQGTPGYRCGDVSAFNLDALAAEWGRSPRDLERVYVALAHPKVGWIEQECIVTFWPRNPDVDDPTAAERMRRMRARRKAEKEAGTVTRNTVTVTTRSDLKKRTGGAENFVNSGDIPKIAQGKASGLLTPEEAEAWRARHPRQGQLPLITQIKKREA